MAEFPQMPLWTDAYLADTTHLSATEHGAYLLLLITMWRAKGNTLPDDDRLLAKYARLSPSQWRRIRSTIEAFFKVKDGRWSNGRLLDELAFVRQQSARQSNNAKARWLKNKRLHRAMALPNECQTDAPTPTPTPIIKNPPLQEGKKDGDGSQKNRGSRIAPDWSLPGDWREWATGFGMSPAMVETEADSFRDYWTAKPGQAGVKLDWLATWRNWCRKAMERKPQRMNGGRQNAADREEDVYRRTMAMARELDRRDAADEELDFGAGDGSVVPLSPKAARG